MLDVVDFGDEFLYIGLWLKNDVCILLSFLVEELNVFLYVSH